MYSPKVSSKKVQMIRLQIYLIIFIAGCSTMQYTPNTQTGSSNKVTVLYDYPKGEYRSLGVIDYDYYQPGFRQPTVTDALPNLKAKVLASGGNALIIRNQRIGAKNNRFLEISAEVLQIQDVLN